MSERKDRPKLVSVRPIADPRLLVLTLGACPWNAANQVADTLVFECFHSSNTGCHDPRSAGRTHLAVLKIENGEVGDVFAVLMVGKRKGNSYIYRMEEWVWIRKSEFRGKIRKEKKQEAIWYLLMVLVWWADRLEEYDQNVHVKSHDDNKVDEAKFNEWGLDDFFF
ncbi:hypothetical protein V6N13_134802 [Hibiscus sabdariffa]